jgi:hypothetical protein
LLIESSMLLPKIHRNSMLPPRCRIEPCMNIDVSTVSHVGGWSERTWLASPQTSCSPAAAHSSPGCVIS